MSEKNTGQPIIEDELKEENQNDSIIEENDEVLQKELHDAAVTENGLVADKFDEAPSIPANEDQLAEFEGKEGFFINYQFNAEEVKKALFIFQKDTVYKKNIIYSMIIAVLFFIYLSQIFIGGESKFAMFMCILTIAVLGMIWYFPLTHIRSTVKAIAAQGEIDYRMTFYEDAIIAGEDENKNVFYFKDNLIKVWETQELFVLGYARQRIFVIPKRCCEEQVTQISTLLQNGLGKNYKRL